MANFPAIYTIPSILFAVPILLLICFSNLKSESIITPISFISLIRVILDSTRYGNSYVNNVY